MPRRNDDFGKDASWQASGGDVGSKRHHPQKQAGGYGDRHIQTFFKGTDNTHPYTTQYEQTLPNWFYYYTQRYLPPNTTYNPTLGTGVDGRYYTNSQNIEISPLAFPATTAKRHVYALRGNPSVVSWIGDLELKGLLAYIFVAAHEQGHRVLNTTPTNLRPNTFISMTPPILINGVPNDADGDGPDDAWAAAHHMGSINPMDLSQNWRTLRACPPSKTI